MLYDVAQTGRMICFLCSILKTLIYAWLTVIRFNVLIYLYTKLMLSLQCLGLLMSYTLVFGGLAKEIHQIIEYEAAHAGGKYSE